jgi:hypothetical protein
MPKKKDVNAKALIKMIGDEKPQAEVMDKFGFKNSSQLKVAYVNALMETGQAPQLIKAAASAANVKRFNTITVNKRGSLIIPKDMVDTYGFGEGDTFSVRKTKTGVSLKKEE